MGITSELGKTFPDRESENVEKGALHGNRSGDFIIVHHTFSYLFEKMCGYPILGAAPIWIFYRYLYCRQFTGFRNTRLRI